MKEKSKTFCVIPFIEIMYGPEERYNFCCVSDHGEIKADDGTYFHIGKADFQTVWNSNYLKNIRQKMINGEEVKACNRCYFQEKIGKDSYRQRQNAEWEQKLKGELDRRIQYAVDNDMNVDKPPVYLDLRLGNLCNLKCRMCNPWNSSQIFKETKELLKTDKIFKQVWTKEFKVDSLKELENWYESNSFWNEIHNMIPTLKKVYMTGGEPTLIQKNYDFLQAIIDANKQDEVQIFFNTNCTNIQDRFINLISQFKNVMINCSIDGFKEINDYIRAPSKWKVIERNFLKLRDLKNITLGITPVFQIYNIFDLVKLFKFANYHSKLRKSDIYVDVLINHHPVCLSVEILPESLKLAGIRNFEKLKGDLELYKTSSTTQQSIDSCINILKKKTKKEPEFLNDFFNYTRSLDKARNQSLKTDIPELWRMFVKDGIRGIKESWPK